jgi:hypothetical protein
MNQRMSKAHPGPGKFALQDRMLREKAAEDAGVLFRTHGAPAGDIVWASLKNPAKSLDERRHARLMIVEIERLDRLGRQAVGSTSLVVWKQPLFSLTRLRSLFRRERRR